MLNPITFTYQQLPPDRPKPIVESLKEDASAGWNIVGGLIRHDFSRTRIQEIYNSVATAVQIYGNLFRFMQGADDRSQRLKDKWGLNSHQIYQDASEYLRQLSAQLLVMSVVLKKSQRSDLKDVSVLPLKGVGIAVVGNLLAPCDQWKKPWEDVAMMAHCGSVAGVFQLVEGQAKDIFLKFFVAKLTKEDCDIALKNAQVALDFANKWVEFIEKAPPGKLKARRILCLVNGRASSDSLTKEDSEKFEAFKRSKECLQTVVKYVTVACSQKALKVDETTPSNSVSAAVCSQVALQDQAPVTSTSLAITCATSEDTRRPQEDRPSTVLLKIAAVVGMCLLMRTGFPGANAANEPGSG